MTKIGKGLLADFFKGDPNVVPLLKRTQGNLLTLPGTVLGQTLLLQGSHTLQQQTCPSRRAQDCHSQHPDWEGGGHRKQNQKQKLEIGHHKFLHLEKNLCEKCFI